MKIIIAGSRTFDNFDLLCKKMNFYNSYGSISEVVSGNARGCDKLGERWANLNKIPLKIFKPNWDELGKSAGFIRNKEMGLYADGLVAFWKHMIDFMKNLKKIVRVVDFC